MNELRNIKNLFEDCGLNVYTNIDCNYAEVSVADLDCVSEYVDVNQMLHADYCMYINYDEDEVVFDEEGLEYLGYWR